MKSANKKAAKKSEFGTRIEHPTIQAIMQLRERCSKDKGIAMLCKKALNGDAQAWADACELFEESGIDMW